MRIISNPRRNIRLSQLKDRRRGFISSSDVKAIKGNKRFNMAINLNALVYSVKSDNAFIPVFGTGEDKIQFEIDLSSFVIDESELVDFESLKKDTKDDWYEIKADILDNVLFDDLDFEDESFENYFDDWIVFTNLERKELLIEIEEFLLKDFDSLDTNDLVSERKNLIRDIKFLEESTNSTNSTNSVINNDEDDFEDDFQDYFNPDFQRYSASDKKKLLDLLEFKLDVINNYLLSSDNWQALSKSTFLSIQQYMIEKERYEILAKPSMYFVKKKY